MNFDSFAYDCDDNFPIVSWLIAPCILSIVIGAIIIFHYAFPILTSGKFAFSTSFYFQLFTGGMSEAFVYIDSCMLSLIYMVHNLCRYVFLCA